MTKFSQKERNCGQNPRGERETTREGGQRTREKKDETVRFLLLLLRSPQPYGKPQHTPVHQVQLPLPRPHLNQTPTLVQSQRPQAQALLPVRALTVHGIGMKNAGGHEGAVSPAVGLKRSAAAVLGDDHSESAGGDAHPYFVLFRMLH